MKIQVIFNNGRKMIVDANSKERVKEEVRKQSANKIRVWNDFIILTDKKAEELETAEMDEFINLAKDLLHSLY